MLYLKLFFKEVTWKLLLVIKFWISQSTSFIPPMHVIIHWFNMHCRKATKWNKGLILECEIALKTMNDKELTITVSAFPHRGLTQIENSISRIKYSTLLKGYVTYIFNLKYSVVRETNHLRTLKCSKVLFKYEESVYLKLYCWVWLLFYNNDVIWIS